MVQDKQRSLSLNKNNNDYFTEQKTKEAFEIVNLIWDNGYIREFDSSKDSLEDDIDFFGIAQIQYKLYNTKKVVKRHDYIGWSWDLETRKANAADKFNNSIEE